MKKNLLVALTTLMVLLAFSMLSFGQESRSTSSAASKFVISAEAGGVNYIQGNVAISRKAGRSGLLLKGDTVKVGDRVSTEGEAKAEILLNPGSYIRIGGESSFEFADTSLENLEIRLQRGSAIFEVITTDGFTFAVSTPKATFNIVKSGVYRVYVLEDGNGRIEVFKGKAQIGEDEDAEVKKGKTATTGADEVAVAKFDRGDRDSFEDWSRSRAKELAKANDRLERNALRSTLLSGFNSMGWNLYDSFGLWVYDPFWGSYCFLPFGYGWSSPYGFGFGRDLWYYRLPRYVYTQPPPPRIVTSPPNETAGTTTRSNPKFPQNPEVRSPVTPPFQRIDQANGRGKVRDDNFDPPGSFPTRTPPIGIIPPSSSSPPASESAPSVKGNQKP